MPTATLVAETLSAWREAERALDRFPSGTPDHETARLLVLELRELYVELTRQREATQDRLAASHMLIRHARQLLEEFGSGT